MLDFLHIEENIGFDEKLAAAFAVYARYDQQEWEMVDEQDVHFSTRHKRRMNRLFRVCVGWDAIPHPEVDTWYEKMCSCILRWVRKGRC